MKAASANLYGGNKTRSSKSIMKSRKRHNGGEANACASGYGGHFRAVQGFKYIGG